MRKIITLLLFINFIGLSFSQEVNTKKWLEKFYSEPENRHKIVTDLRFYYVANSRDSVFYIGNLALQTGIEEDNYSLMILGKLVLASYYNKVGKLDLSKTYLNQCISYYKRKDDQASLSDAENQMGITYLNSNNHPKAIEYFLKSYETSKNLPDDNEMFQGQINLAEVYLRDGQFDLAEAEALSYLERVKKMNLQNGIKNAYDKLGKIYVAKKDLKLGYGYYQKGLLLALKNGSKLQKAESYNNIAIVYFENGDLTLAKEYFLKALKLRKEINNLIGIADSYYNLGDWHYYQEQYREAIPFYIQSMEFADSNNLVKESADAMFKIALNYEELKDYKSASSFYSKYIKANIGIEKNMRSKQLEIQRLAYEIQREEDKLNQSKREKILKIHNEKNRDKAKLFVIVFSILTSALLLLYLFTFLKRNINKFSEKRENHPPVLSEKEIELTKRLEALEGFIIADDKSLNHESSFMNDKVKATSGIQVFQLNNDRLVFWETNTPKLESFIFNSYMQSKINEITDTSSLAEVINQQNIIDPLKLTYGLICDQENKVLVCGNNGLLIQNENKMAFMTESKLDVKEYSVFVSENLKNYLLENSLWDKFLKQIDMTNKMSMNMALKTIESSFGADFDINQLGVFIVKP